MALQENTSFQCPYCIGANFVCVDITAGKFQQLITDCEVCCQPIVIRVELNGNNIVSLFAEQENP